jgi:hypothetical protein
VRLSALDIDKAVYCKDFQWDGTKQKLQKPWRTASTEDASKYTARIDRFFARHEHIRIRALALDPAAGIEVSQRHCPRCRDCDRYSSLLKRRPSLLGHLSSAQGVQVFIPGAKKARLDGGEAVVELALERRPSLLIRSNAICIVPVELIRCYPDSWPVFGVKINHEGRRVADHKVVGPPQRRVLD